MQVKCKQCGTEFDRDDAIENMARFNFPSPQQMYDLNRGEEYHIDWFCSYCSNHHEGEDCESWEIHFTGSMVE